MDYLTPFEKTIGRLCNFNNADDLTHYKDHLEQKLKDSQTTIDELESDIICRNSDRNELQIKLKDRDEIIKSFVIFSEHDKSCAMVKNGEADCTCELGPILDKVFNADILSSEGD